MQDAVQAALIKQVRSSSNLVTHGALQAYAETPDVCRRHGGDRTRSVDSTTELLNCCGLSNYCARAKTLERKLFDSRGVGYVIGLSDSTISPEGAIRTPNLRDEAILTSYIVVASPRALFWNTLTPKSARFHWAAGFLRNTVSVAERAIVLPTGTSPPEDAVDTVTAVLSFFGGNQGGAWAWQRRRRR